MDLRFPISLDHFKIDWVYAAAANTMFMQLRVLVLIIVHVSKCSSVTGGNLQQVGFNIPLRCIFKPS
jgi:hypothetical protein